MNLLHTSDWHLGRMLHGARRYDEFEAFLNWLIECINKEKVDILTVAGDIFDTTTPSVRAQSLYYKFLGRLLKTCCRHVVIVSGNHDSGAVLDAPKEILRALNVIVVGNAFEDPASEVFELKDNDKKTEAIICAVPYLRDRDLIHAEFGENYTDRAQRLIESLRKHYQTAAEKAEELRGKRDIPIIATGHLMATGGKTTQDDGVRDLYIGSLSSVRADTFPDSIDYVALGHLHMPQLVGQKSNVQYSGSPIAMGFGEAKQQKYVILCKNTGRAITAERLNIPVFRELQTIKGDLKSIIQGIQQLKLSDSKAWLKIECTELISPAILKKTVDDELENSEMTLLVLQNLAAVEAASVNTNADINVSNLSFETIFEMFLDDNNIEKEKRTELLDTYSEALKLYNEQEEE